MSEMMNALRMFADEKMIGIEDLVEAIEEAVAKAAQDRLGRDQLSVLFREKEGEFELYETVDIVDDEEPSPADISLEEARMIDPEAVSGGTVKRRIEMEGLGRIAALSVRRMISKKGKEMEALRISTSYKKRIGEVIKPKFLRVGDEGYMFDLGDAKGSLPPDERLAKDRFERGKEYKVAIASVDESKRFPIVILSRVHPALLKRLMEIESPELLDDTIEIVAIARHSSGRSKVAVRSRKSNVDPVGSLVGVRGSRIQPVSRELSGEKIDIFHYSENPEELIASALTPAKNLKVTIFDENAKTADVIAPDDQLSLAIGKGGVNVKLAHELTGWTLDVMNVKELDEKRRRLEEMGKHDDEYRRMREEEEKNNGPTKI